MLIDPSRNNYHPFDLPHRTKLTAFLRSIQPSATLAITTCYFRKSERKIGYQKPRLLLARSGKKGQPQESLYKNTSLSLSLSPIVKLVRSGAKNFPVLFLKMSRRERESARGREQWLPPVTKRLHSRAAR